MFLIMCWMKEGMKEMKDEGNIHISGRVLVDIICTGGLFFFISLTHGCQ